MFVKLFGYQLEICILWPRYANSLYAFPSMSSFRARFFKSCTVWNFKTCPVPMSRLKFFVQVWLRLLLKHTYSFQIIPAMVPLEGELRVNACVLVEVGRTYKSGRVHGISSASGEHYLIEIFEEDKPRKFTVKQIFPFFNALCSKYFCFSIHCHVLRSY